MPKRRKNAPEDEPGPIPRSQTEFYETRYFVDDLEDVERGSRLVAAWIRSDVQRFRQTWRDSKPGAPLPDAFKFKHLATAPGEYRVCQIYVCGGNYRTAILFVHDGSNAYLIAIWKKTKRENPNDVKRAIDRAAELWVAMRRQGRTDQ